MNILVCDDDKEIVEAIKIYLENEGYHVLKAYNGAEALDVIENQDIHLIIMDIIVNWHIISDGDFQNNSAQNLE